MYGLGELAEHYGVTLALEVLRYDESNLVHNLPTLQKMLNELDHRAIGGMIDTIPMALAEEHPSQYLKALGRKLVHIHFIDGAPRGHLAWGDGILDMNGYLAELDEYAYSGYLSLEIKDGRYFMNPSASVEPVSYTHLVFLWKCSGLIRVQFIVEIFSTDHLKLQKKIQHLY